LTLGLHLCLLLGLQLSLTLGLQLGLAPGLQLTLIWSLPNHTTLLWLRGAVSGSVDGGLLLFPIWLKDKWVQASTTAQLLLMLLLRVQCL